MKLLLTVFVAILMMAPSLVAEKREEAASPHSVEKKEKFLKVITIDQLRKALASLDEGAVVFLDVDNTLITAESALFHYKSPYRKLIDELKKDKAKYPHFETILSRWRLNRKVRLVSEEWPLFLRELRGKHPVYALTQMDTGPLGEIPSMELWRYEELTRMGLVFTSKFSGIQKRVLIPGGDKCSAVFFQGIFMTGASSKGDVLRVFLKTLKPRQVVLVDDLKEHLHDAESVCAEHHVPFLGILYAGKEILPGRPPSPEIAEFQKRLLFEKAEWLEDEAAAIRWKQDSQKGL